MDGCVESSKTPSPPPLAGSLLLEVLEALLFVGSQPLSADTVTQAYPEVTKADFEQAIRELRQRYRRQERPYQIVRDEYGYSLEIIEPYLSELAEKTRSQRQIKLPRAAIDVLSVVAYRQPIEKAALDEIIGLETAGTLRQLVKRGLLFLEKPDDGSPPRYVTTPRFLDLFGIESLADVPRSDDLEKM
ncbi:SMC-Scp complex subunit ScpB [bacterium]|nr:SMC-Scp complex subunit ScpB [bacterium]